MRIHIYTKTNCSSPAHTASKSLARLLVANRLVVAFGEGALQLTTDESWKSIKERLRPILRPAVNTVIERLKPPGRPSSLILQYPPKDQSSYATRDKKALWGAPAVEFNRRIGGNVSC